MSSPETPPQDEAVAPPAPQPREFTHRRAPRYRSFILTGVVLGAIATALLYRFTKTPFSTDGIVGYLGSILVMLGAVLGAGVALLVERGQTRRSGRR